MRALRAAWGLRNSEVVDAVHAQIYYAELRLSEGCHPDGEREERSWVSPGMRTCVCVLTQTHTSGAWRARVSAFNGLLADQIEQVC